MKRSKILVIFLFIFLSNMTISPVLSNFVHSGKFETQDQNLNSLKNNQSVILMIGDGMGFAHVNLARLVEVGQNNSLHIDKFNNNYSVITNNVDDQLTDSAAAATAMATGEKTLNSYLSIDPEDNILPTILEYAKSLNKSTGVITTTEVVHATPAAFYSHSTSRYDVDTIVNYLLTSNIDIAMGGGRSEFNSTAIKYLEDQGYNILENKSSLESTISQKLIGLFAPSHFPFVKDRPDTTPSLPLMTKISLDKLSKNSNGFFLMIEGGEIDFAGHDNDKVDDALETIEFDQAVAVVQKYVSSHPNTLLIVTADHETGGLKIIDSSLDENVPQTGLSELENQTLRINRVNKISVSYSTGGHTTTQVPLKLFTNIDTFGLPTNTVLQNTEINSIMRSFIDLDLPTFTTSTQVTTTTIQQSTVTTQVSTTTGSSKQDNSVIGFELISIIFVMPLLFEITRKRRHF